MKILVVDDEHLQHKSLQNLFDQSSFDINAFYFSGYKDFFFELEDHQDADCIFLDVEMPIMDGLQIAKKIRTINTTIPIIFITAYSQYAIKGYEVQAFDYILKPVSLERLEAVLNNLSSLVIETDYLLLIDNQKLQTNSIIYIEAQGHSCLFHLENKQIETKESLSNIGQLLPDSFVQCHRSFWINIDHVYQVNRDHVVMDNQDIVFVSRRNQKLVLDKFVSHYRQKEYSL